MFQYVPRDGVPGMGGCGQEFALGRSRTHIVGRRQLKDACPSGRAAVGDVAILAHQIARISVTGVRRVRAGMMRLSFAIASKGLMAATMRPGQRRVLLNGSTRTSRKAQSGI
jgi:hypothetical protein